MWDAKLDLKAFACVYSFGLPMHTGLKNFFQHHAKNTLHLVLITFTKCKWYFKL